MHNFISTNSTVPPPKGGGWYWYLVQYRYCTGTELVLKKENNANHNASLASKGGKLTFESSGLIDCLQLKMGIMPWRATHKNRAVPALAKRQPVGLISPSPCCPASVPPPGYFSRNIFGGATNG
jgi:hypothetical protein